MAIVRRQNGRSVPTQGWGLANFGDFDNVFSNFDRLFSEVATPLMGQSQALNGYPADLYETGEAVVLEMAVPGLTSENLDISLEGRHLTVRGNYPETSGERRYWFKGIPRGEFTRAVTLPTAVETDKVQASIHDGFLTLTMPKVAEAQARKIAITNG